MRLQFITHSTERYSYLESARIALDGGCRWIQLRMKESSDEEVLDVARTLVPLCHDVGATLLLDDRVHLVEQAGADGVHLGLKDMPIVQARQILGRDKIIGGTANTIDDVVLHARSGADYIGCGPFRYTTTKKNLSPTLGLQGYSAIVEAMRERAITLPIVAIGGIGYDDIEPIMLTGVSGVALSGAVLQAYDPRREMQRIVKLLHI